MCLAWINKSESIKDLMEYIHIRVSAVMHITQCLTNQCSFRYVGSKTWGPGYKLVVERNNIVVSIPLCPGVNYSVPGSHSSILSPVINCEVPHGLGSDPSGC